jgi:hypothetical protein
MSIKYIAPKQTDKQIVYPGVFKSIKGSDTTVLAFNRSSGVIIAGSGPASGRVGFFDCDFINFDIASEWCYLGEAKLTVEVKS